MVMVNNTALVNSIIETGQHSWPWLGMSFSVLNVQMQQELKVGTPVIIGQVWNQTSASRAGLQPGWGVVKIDDISIRSLRDIERVVYSKRVGEQVALILQMGQQQQRVALLHCSRRWQFETLPQSQPSRRK